jgi:hypothetical protein
MPDERSSPSVRKKKRAGCCAELGLHGSSSPQRNRWFADSSLEETRQIEAKR